MTDLTGTSVRGASGLRCANSVGADAIDMMSSAIRFVSTDVSNGVCWPVGQGTLS
ncbi:MAG: hypothetical protein ABJC26_08080 [Gemmatimonadaceae bacterium]